LFFRLHEQRKFLVRGNDCVEVFAQLEHPPRPGQAAPGRGQGGQLLGTGGGHTRMSPKRGLLLRPQAQEAMVRGEGMNPLPQQGPQGIGQGEIGKAFAVDASLPLEHLQAHGADDAAVVLGYLELGDSSREFVGGKAHQTPQLDQLSDIVERGPAHAVLWGAHHA